MRQVCLRPRRRTGAVRAVVEGQQQALGDAPALRRREMKRHLPSKNPLSVEAEVLRQLRGDSNHVVVFYFKKLEQRWGKHDLLRHTPHAAWTRPILEREISRGRKHKPHPLSEWHAKLTRAGEDSAGW